MFWVQEERGAAANKALNRRKAWNAWQRLSRQVEVGHNGLWNRRKWAKLHSDNCRANCLTEPPKDGKSLDSMASFWSEKVPCHPGVFRLWNRGQCGTPHGCHAKWVSFVRHRPIFNALASRLSG